MRMVTMLDSKTRTINDYLNHISDLSDDDLDLAKAALSLAAMNSPDISTEKYYHHIEKMVVATKARYQEILNAGGDDDAGTQLAALKHVLVEKNDYRGDDKDYDDLQNANLIRVIERRKGLPIALSILYVHVGQQAGFDVTALSFPAHVICRLEKNGERLLFDPFSSCKVMQAPDLRQLLKSLMGEHAELSTEFYETSSKREMLVRLQNNIKLRQVEGEDYEGALNTVETLQLIDPSEYRLSLDAGVLNARIGRLTKAIIELEHYIDNEQDDTHRRDAAAFLQQIRMNLT